ncbi:helix-turn-helix transcriptional regulator [Pengzhenrongella frigida]|uniref:LuxR family transcriptional regulator n=1 Tax=Pengzhenrongella frigida TaxID=1259133 RepID=A0A4Q5MZM1_9MICO|nr:helix-turn-helix transcriptional regulator [Cellulomonas sp. HLT2-17]RYV51312.1 LuxR family transcriptional regulator [Cellulomonas sp. HLT2-17]
MTDEGPLRTDITNEIAGYLRAGTSVEVVGMRSSGRSAVLTRVSEQLASEGFSITRIAGVRALRDRPLSALAVTGINLALSSGLQSLTSAVDELEDLLSSGPAVLVVDDADDLDATTVGALAAVRLRLRIPIVAATLPAARGRSDAPGLTNELRPAVRVALPPLRFDEVHRLVHVLLGGPVDPTAVARIAAKSGGLPGLVSAMVATGRRASRLAPRGGIWVARGDLWTTALAPAAEQFLTDLDEASLEAIALVSSAGTPTMEAALHAIAPETLARLDDVGLLRVVRERHDTVVGVFPPLVAEYFTHEGSMTRRMLVCGQLAPAGVEDSRGPVLAPRSLHLPGTDPILSRRFAGHWRDEVQARQREWEADASPSNAVPLIRALLVSRARPHEVEAVLAATVVPGADPRALALFVTWHALYEGLVLGRVDAARALLHDRRSALQGFDGLLRATEAHLELVTGSVPTAALLAPAAHDEDQLSTDSVVVARAEALVAAGQAPAALTLLEGFTTPFPALEESAEATRELALLYMCDLEGAVTAARARVGRSTGHLDPGGVEAHAYVAGLGLALQGRLLELDALMSFVLALAPMPAHRTHVQTGLLWLAADAAAWQGRTAYAHSLALQSSAYGHGRGPHPGMTSDGISAELRGKDPAASADELWALAEERLEHGFIPAGIIAGVSAVERRPDAVWAARLADAAARCDSPLLSHLGDYAVAIASSDPDRLAELEPRLLAAGMRLYAVRTAVARSVRMLTAGDVTAAAAHADTAWHTAGLRGRDLCGLFRPFDKAVCLTAREREMAILVARGMSSQEIATLKVLSVRTVENHIFSACRKVGVKNRESLAHAAQTWLSCAVD